MEKKRLYYIDNLRVATIMLVIMIHLAVTYSGIGIWFYNELRTLGFFNHIFFSFFQAFVQGFSMGMLFFVAGYFTPMAYDRKSPSRFISDRFRRLGLPALFFMLVITPLQLWVMKSPRWDCNTPNFFESYWLYLQSFCMKLFGVGPMWFTLALFVFCVIYMLWRLVRPQVAKPDFQKVVLTTGRLLTLTAIIAVVAFTLRLSFPVGSIFWGMQLGFFSQYIIMFIAGIVACRTNCFESMTSATGRKLLAAGLILGFTGWLILKYFAGPYDFSTLTMKAVNTGKRAAGGLSWPAAYYAVWESFVAVAMTMGLLSLFRDKLNFMNSLTQKLSVSAFAVYMFHPPILVAVTLLMGPLNIMPVLKWALAVIISIPLCFLIGYYILLRIPLLNRIL
ncbi:MAG: acyltransferase family protein [Deltaproteobacteria bacterium]|nr:acyltransferase family protein [Deltaproteobacteria bacterium]